MKRGLLALAVLASACGSTGITAAKVQASVLRSFENAYVRETAALGRPVSLPQLGASAGCVRTTPGARAEGPGEDWACTISYRAVDGTAQSFRYDTKVRSNGCWTVVGPASVLGAAVLVAPDGRTVPNRLLQMDGCFPL